MTFSLIQGRIENPEGLELNVVHHCNLSCRSCSHLSPVMKRAAVEPEAVYTSLARLARSYHAAYCKLLGGEPLLHPALLEVIEAVRSSGVARRIHLCTNGRLLERMPGELWAAIDQVELSNYPSAALDVATIRKLASTARDHGTEFVVFYYDHFRECFSEPGSESAPLVDSIYRTCKMVRTWFCHNVVADHFFKCPQSYFLDRLLRGNGNAPWEDGLCIGDDEQFRDRLLAYLNNPQRLSACGHCLGSVGRRFAHEQQPRDRWRQPQQLPTEQLLDREFMAALQQDIDADEGCTRATCPV